MEVEKNVRQVSFHVDRYSSTTTFAMSAGRENKKNQPAQYIATVKKTSTAVEEIPGKCGKIIIFCRKSGKKKHCSRPMFLRKGKNICHPPGQVLGIWQILS